MITHTTEDASEANRQAKTSHALVTAQTFRGFDLHSEELNQRLNAVKREFGMRRAVSTRSLTGETRTFAEILDQEVETIVFYYLEVQGLLAKKMRLLRARQTGLLQDVYGITLARIDELCVLFREVGGEVLALLSYLERNSFALKKILHKHDTLFDQKMSSMYFDTRLGNASSTRSSQLRQLYHQEGLKAVVDAMRRGFEELYDARNTLLQTAELNAITAAATAAAAASDEPFVSAVRERYRERESSGGSREDVSLSLLAPNEADTETERVRDRPRQRRKSIPRVPFSKRLASFSASLNLLEGDTDTHVVPSHTDTLADTQTDTHAQREHWQRRRSDGDAFASEIERAAAIVREREKESETDRERDRERGSQRESVSRARSTGSLWSYFQLADSTDVSALHTDAQGETEPPRRRSLSELEPILKQIQEVSERVTKTQSRSNLEFIANLDNMGLEIALRDYNRVEKEISSDAAAAAAAARTGKQTERERESDRENVRTSRAALAINLFVTFLYMANQYIVAPSSGRYADLLGMPASMSGVIIGFAPAAALLSSLAYSMWSNVSFTQPLLCGVLCGIGGNICYGAALQCASPTLIFVGRILTGFGGTRVVSRRYIADHVSLKDRLWASSAFVTAGALGLAFGPLISSLIERSDIAFSCTTSLFGGEVVWLHYESVTAPGWIMAVFWMIGLVVVALYFEEPLIKRSPSFTTTMERGRSLMNYGAISAQEVVHVETGNELWADGADEESHDDYNTHATDRDPILAKYMNPSSSRYLYNNNNNFPHAFARQAPLPPSKGTEMNDNKLLSFSAPRCWTHISAEVCVMLFLTMVNKAGQEMSVACMPVVLKRLFLWESEGIGYYMACIGALVLPANVFLHQLAKGSEEREMLLYLTYLSLAALLLICRLRLLSEDDDYSPGRYLVGTAVLFTSLCALEGIIMSLISKLISPELAKGTFNSGMLATEAGTFGRVLGDSAITLFSSMPTSNEFFVNQLYFPLVALILSTVVLSKMYYNKLEE